MERVTGFSFQYLPAFPFQSGTEATRARCRSSALKSRSRVFSEHAAATIRIYFAPPSARFAGIWIIQRSNESRKDTAAKFCRSKIFLCRSLPFPLLFFFKSAPNAKCYKQSFARRRNTRRTPHSTIRFMQVFAAKTNFKIEELTIIHDEVAEIKMVDFKEFQKMIEENPEDFMNSPEVALRIVEKARVKIENSYSQAIL